MTLLLELLPVCPSCDAPLKPADDLCPRCGNYIPWTRQR